MFEEFFYTFSSLAGPVEFYINSRDNNIALEVFQSQTQGGDYTTTYTSASALAITSTDVITKGLSGLNESRKLEHPGSLVRKSYGPAGGFIEDQFKLLWTHNPNDGQYYKIRVYKGKKHGGFLQSSSAGTFGYKIFYPSDSVTNETRSVPNISNFDYTGIVHNVMPSDFTLTTSTQYIDTGYYGSIPYGEYISDAQKFAISITGLKPNTYHKFMFDGEDQTAKCSQTRTSTTNTSGLLSDVNGTLNFDFYFDAGIDEAISDFEQQNKLAAAKAGTKIFTVESYDRNSKSTGSIGLKYYANIPYNYSDVRGGGLNISQTVTMSSTNDPAAATAAAAVIAEIPSGTTSQVINDAIERNNVRFVNFDNLNEQLR